MASLFSFASTFVKRAFYNDPFTVTEVRIEDYLHYDIVDRSYALIIHSYVNENAQTNYEIVLNKENQTKTAYSIYRSTNSEECQIYYLRLKDKLPVFVQKLPNLLTVSFLQETCKYINNNVSQNVAHICAYFGYVDFFKQLQMSPSSNSAELELINVRDDSGKTPLQVAIESQRLNVIQAILSLSPKLNLVDNYDNNILHVAAQTNQQIITTLCIAISTRSTLSTLQLPNANSNQHDDDNDELVSLILLINTKNGNNFTPLYLACVNDKPECVKELLKNGADVNGASICDQTNIPRDESFDLSDNKLINKLNVKDMKNGGTPLHWCKSVEVIEMLVEMNCNLNARNFHGDTALHIMVSRANLSCVLSLLNHGADVNAIGANGNTPLHLAVKANDTPLVQAIIVFGADVDVLNSIGESARHLAATATVSPRKDVILYILNSVCAKRCNIKRPNCTEGCAPEFLYNGVPPENTSLIRNTEMFDNVLMNSIVTKAMNARSKSNECDPSRKRVKLLSLDGGGIRGLILIQVLSYIENYLKKPIVEIFDWTAGTSTGAILALLLSSGYKADECRQIYFQLKDKIFVGFRPYCSDTLEKFLQKYLGGEKRMSSITKSRLMVTATVADNFPPHATFFRNYAYPRNVLSESQMDDNATRDELVWKVARASGAAPTYFSQFESFLDGGLISNNPTLDLLTEIQQINRSNEVLDLNETFEIDLVVSVGTGSIPEKPIERLNFSLLSSFTGISSFASNIGTLMKVLIEQASQANGQVVERAQAWCSMIGVPFFRINPPISEDIQMDESDNVKLVNMLWETMAYIHMHKEDFNQLITLLLEK